MRILIIADYLPYPLIGGDRIRIYNLLRRVSSHHEVSLAAFLDTPNDAEGVSHLQHFCARVETVRLQRRHPVTHLPGLLQYVLEGKPPELKFFHYEELVSKVRQLVSTMDFDIVQIEHAHMGMYLDFLPQNRRYKSLLMLHNFTFQQYSRSFRVERRWNIKIRSFLNSIAMRHWEPRYAERFDRCTTVSEIDRHLLLQVNPRLRIDVIPNGVDTQRYQPLLDVNTPPHVLFIGNMGYAPCTDAVLFFCREILPLVRQVLSSVEFWIVGRNPPPEVLRLAGNGVHVTGQVEDVIPYYRQTKVSVVPLRAGGGTRLKILESMALGRPVVSTTIGCEGLNVTHGEHLLIADDAEQFAAHTVDLLSDGRLNQYITMKGRQFVEAHYDWDSIARRLMDVYVDLLESAPL